MLCSMNEINGVEQVVHLELMIQISQIPKDIKEVHRIESTSKEFIVHSSLWK